MAKPAEEWAAHARDVVNAIEDMDDWRGKGLAFADLIEDTRKRDAEIAAEAAAREREEIIERLRLLTYRSSWGETIEACIAAIRTRQEPQP